MPEPTTLTTAAPIIAKIASHLVSPAKRIAATTREKLEIKFKKGFERYIEKQLARASTVKTIISSNTPIPLLDVYVKVNVLLTRAADGAAMNKQV
jgi:hypothetical protein